MFLQTEDMLNLHLSMSRNFTFLLGQIFNCTFGQHRAKDLVKIRHAVWLVKWLSKQHRVETGILCDLVLRQFLSATPLLLTQILVWNQPVLLVDHKRSIPWGFNSHFSPPLPTCHDIPAIHFVQRWCKLAWKRSVFLFCDQVVKCYIKSTSTYWSRHLIITATTNNHPSLFRWTSDLSWRNNLIFLASLHWFGDALKEWRIISVLLFQFITSKPEYFVNMTVTLSLDTKNKNIKTFFTHMVLNGKHMYILTQNNSSHIETSCQKLICQ